jgi:hypothetical protein
VATRIDATHHSQIDGATVTVSSAVQIFSSAVH